MSDPNEGVDSVQPYTMPNGVFNWGTTGLTKRELFAVTIMAGMVSSETEDFGWGCTGSGPRTYAVSAIALADALLTELNKEPKEKEST